MVFQKSSRESYVRPNQALLQNLQGKRVQNKANSLRNHAEASVGNFVLWITYERSAEEISNSREWLTKTPFKTIKKEQYVISDMSLIGNIGGTLGMFVGFSFLAKTEWVLTKLEGLLRRFRNRIGVSEKTDVNSQFQAFSCIVFLDIWKVEMIQVSKTLL